MEEIPLHSASVQTTDSANQKIPFISCHKTITIPRWKQYAKCEKITKSSLIVTSPNPAYLRNGKLKGFMDYIMDVQEGRNYSRLERLILDFTECYELGWSSLVELFEKIASRFWNIKQLDFSLSKTQLAAEEAVVKIGTTIGSKCRNLTHLTLNLTLCYNAVTDKSIRELFLEIVFNLKSLQSLILDLTNCFTLKNLPIEELMDENTPKFKTLQKLVLDVTSCTPLTDKTLGELALYIGKHLRRVKHLELDFTSCANLTDQTAIELLNQIGSNLKYLECLGFRVSNCTQLTKSPLEVMATQLSTNLPNLKAFCFGYSQEISELIDEDSLISLFWQIQSKNLEYLRLNLSNCTALTDEVLKILSADTLSCSKRQQHLELKFSSYTPSNQL